MDLFSSFEPPKVQNVPQYVETKVFPIPDDVPMSVLKQVQELCDYYDAPGMSCVVFEGKLNRLKAKIDKIIAERK